MVKVEIYKLFYNKLTLGILFLLSLGIQVSERFKPDFWLLTACVLVGQVLGEGFTDGNLRNEIMAIQGRKKLIMEKLASAIIITFFIYLINICVFSITSGNNILTNRLQLGFIGYQFLLIVAQAVFLMGLNMFLKSYSGLAIATMILFVFYHVCETVQGKSIMYFISKCTFLKLFFKVDILGGVVFGLTSIILFLFGMGYFKKTEF